MAKRRGWRGPEEPGEFPTLGYQVRDFIEASCVIPDGERMGDPYLLTDEMTLYLLWYYRINPAATYDRKQRRWINAFHFNRGGQLVRPQKWGKGPFSSAVVCNEAQGPALFDGWDANGEPVGRPWPTPLIQITALSEDQTDNVWAALLPMIELGEIAAEIPDTGLTRINLPGGGKIEPVTSAARSRLGQRVTALVQDQTESWVQTNGGRALADNQRRNIAGMGGRWMSTANAWDPAEESVAQYTAEHELEGVYHDDVEPGEGSIRNKADRKRMLRKVYGDSWWVDQIRIDAEIRALLERDPAQAERWFLNRKAAGEARAFRLDRYKKLAKPRQRIPKRALVVAGVDGARFADALAIVATDVKRAHQWPIGIWERPKSAPDDYEHPFHEIDGAMIDFFERYSVWRVYIDPQYIEEMLLQPWQNRWGDKRIIPWLMNRPKQVAWAVRNYSEAIAAGDLSHDGDPLMVRHIGQAVKQKVNVFDDKHRQMHTISKDRPDSPRKMDGAAAGTLSWEARGDAIAADAKPSGPSNLYTFPGGGR